MKVATLSLDASGCLFLPEDVREEAGLSPGMAVEIRYGNGRVEIKTSSPQVQIVEKGGVYVAMTESPLEPLTAEAVRATQEAVRERHHES